VHGALLVVQIAFASQAVEGKLAMLPRALGGEGIDPVALALVRMLGGALFFASFSSLFRLRTKTTAGDQMRLAMLSLIGIVANQTLFLVGLRSTTPVSAALLGVTIPVFTAALSVLARRERSSVRLWVGLAIATLGVLWLTGIRSVDRGAVLVTINSVFYSAYVVSSQGMVRRLGAMTVITWVFVWGAVLFTPFALPSLIRNAPTWTPRGYVLVAWIVAMPTIVAYLFNAWALGKTAPSLVTVYICFQPIIAGLLAWAQLGQAPPGRALFAALLIVAGVSIVATRRILSDAERMSLRG
jgi:drug/metabolite transporter (DMT)-like permease